MLVRVDIGTHVAPSFTKHCCVCVRARRVRNMFIVVSLRVVVSAELSRDGVQAALLLAFVVHIRARVQKYFMLVAAHAGKRRRRSDSSF